MCKLKHEDGTLYTEYNFWKYYKLMFLPAASKLSWLWFLVALFVNSLCNYPLLAWIRRRTQHKDLELKTDGVYVLSVCIVMGLWGWLNVWLNSEPQNVWELLPMAMVNLGYNLVLMVMTYILSNVENDHWKIMIKFIPPLACCTLHHWRNGWNQEDLYGLFSMINYDMIFMSAGMVDNFYWHTHKKTLVTTFVNSNLAPFMVVSMSFIIAITIPAIDVNTGDIFNYPLYAFTWVQCFYSIGGWFWIYFWTYFSEVFSNSKFNVPFYMFYNGASMYGYVVHYIFIVLSCKWFIIPN